MASRGEATARGDQRKGRRTLPAVIASRRTLSAYASAALRGPAMSPVRWKAPIQPSLSVAPERSRVLLPNSRYPHELSIAASEQGPVAGSLIVQTSDE